MNAFQVTLRHSERPDLSRVLEIEAPNREQAAALAAKPGFRVALVKPLKGVKKSGRAKGGIPRKELIKLFRGLASMLKANISTSDALLYYAQGLPDPALQAALMNIRNRLEAGIPVQAAFAKEQCFDSTIITIIEAGSDSGQLGDAFSSLARRIKIEMMFASKLRSALLVPSIIILFQIGLFIYSQVYVVAQVEDTLKSVRQEPDALSQQPLRVKTLALFCHRTHLLSRLHLPLRPPAPAAAHLPHGPLDAFEKARHGPAPERVDRHPPDALCQRHQPRPRLRPLRPRARRHAHVRGFHQSLHHL